MSRYDLTDFEWRVIAPLLPNKPRGVPRVDDRRVLNGMPSGEWGESLHAFIVPHVGAAIEHEAILAFCRAQLAGFKVPRTISVINQLPRNAGGKVMKALLRERAP
jgi:acyl-CoA synthetase (AMP-forming)/AMP-acid ligase II